jgi:phosphoglycerate-specific signal transduction histidine kinase
MNATCSMNDNSHCDHSYSQAITFRETTNGVLTTLNHCLELISQKEDNFKRKLDRETDRRKKVEEELKECQENLVKTKMAATGPGESYLKC